MAAFGVAAAVDGRICPSEKAQLWMPYQQAVAEDGRHAVFTGGDKSGQDDYLKHACPKTFRLAKGDIVVGARHRARADSTPPTGRNGANSSDAMPSASTRSTKQGAQT
ncbi:hypothetical protein [Streptomyces sp. NPDC057403]|uniref:hypothetical protein n=1 Tax=Streptomyces sp. NPDC057403 TaxID=3346119 RepID=UPI0036B61682